MQSYYIKPKAFYDSFGDVQPSQPYSYTYGDRPTFSFSFLPNEIAEGDTLVFAVDNDMVFYDSTPENILHSASCMVVVRHDVTAEEVTAGKVQMRIETRTVKFRDVTNGKVRPVEVVSGLYRRRGSDGDINYVLLAKGRAFANGIIADYNALPEPVTTADELYTKGETDSLLDAKADKADLVAHTDDTTIHVTQQEKTEWSNKADRNDIGTATITITQGGTSKGAFSVNASENVTIEVNDGAQADWNETDTSSPSYIQNKPSVYTKTETDGMLDAKADKATTLAGYGITDAYTKDETDAKVSAVYRYKGSVATYAELPTEGNTVGDVWNVATADEGHGIKAGDNVAWTGSAWDALSGEVDLTPFALKADAATDHNHDDKYLSLENGGVIANGSIKLKQPDDEFVGRFRTYNGTTSGFYSNAIGQFASAEGPHSVAIGFYSKAIEHGEVSIGGETRVNVRVAKNEILSVTTESISTEVPIVEQSEKLSDKYAAKSHTHAMGDITGLPASGGTAGQVLTKTETGSEWDDLPDTTDYLRFTALVAGSTVRLNRFGTPPTINLEYSVDKKNWTEYTWNGNDGATITLANIGDNVWWRGNNTTISSGTNALYRFSASDEFEASGNVMSLLDKSCKSVTIPTAYCFYGLFINSKLKNAPKLPATTLSEHCYDAMFQNCRFTKAPELPATTMVNGCYKQMFQNCTSLQKAPELPATTLADYCYSQMFYKCSSLTKAPELSDASSANYCYSNMFSDCVKLKKIKVNLTYWTDESTVDKSQTSHWLSGVSQRGVFECPSNLNCATRDASHVPSGWTIVRTDSPKSITSPTTEISSTNVWIAPGASDVRVYTVSSPTTLNSGPLVASTDIAYAEIVLDVATGATVTAGTNITLVDTPTAGKRNICVCRWSGGVCKLYVVIVEDLPQA